MQTRGRVEGHAKKHGIEIKEQYWTLGAYDGLIIFDASDDETATAAMLSLSSREYVTTQTMRSFNAGEMSKIVAKVT
ncbi:MAG: GYD domain-containing protein [Gemmataceae bacterium]